MLHSTAKFIFLALIFLAYTYNTDTFFLKICSTNATDRDQQIQQFNHILRWLENGMQLLQLPPLEPLHISNIFIPQAIDMVNVYLINVELSNFISGELCNIHGFSANISEQMHISMRKYTQRVIMRARYETNGTFFTLKLGTAGKFEWILSNLDSAIKFKLTPVVRKAQIYMHVSEFAVNSTVKSIKVSMLNLKGPELAVLHQQQLNSQAKQLFQRIQPQMSTVIAKEYTHTLNKIIENIPYLRSHYTKKV